MQIIPDRTNEQFSDLLQIFEEELANGSVQEMHEGAEFERGENAGNFLFLKQGVIKVAIKRGETKMLLGIFKTGDLIDRTLFSEEANRYTLKAATNVKAGFINGPWMEDLINIFPKMKAFEVELKKAWAVFLGERFCSVLSKRPTERIADLIRGYIGLKGAIGYNLWDKFSVGDLASYCNMTEDEFNYYYKKLLVTGQLQLIEKAPSALCEGKVTI